MTIDEIRALQARLESHAEFLRDSCAQPLGAFTALNISNQITLAVDLLDTLVAQISPALTQENTP